MPGFFQNERIEEWRLLLADNLTTLNQRRWYALLAVIVLALPLGLGLRLAFFELIFHDYQGPTVTRPSAAAEPLVVVDKQIFALTETSYSGLFKIRNINLERGVEELAYRARFLTYGGTVLAQISGKTFVLPASEKIVVLGRFESSQPPDWLEIELLNHRFRYQPQLPPINLEIQRVQLEPVGGLAVSAVIKNLSAFTVNQVYLPVLLYNPAQEIVGVNATLINDLQSQEVRSFRYVWPGSIDNVIRAEINPEVNLFDRNLLSSQLETVSEAE